MVLKRAGLVWWYRWCWTHWNWFCGNIYHNLGPTWKCGCSIVITVFVSLATNFCVCRCGQDIQVTLPILGVGASHEGYMCISMDFWSCDLCFWKSFGHCCCQDILMPTWPICACELPMSGRCTWEWNFDPVTLTLAIFWTLLRPRYWCQLMPSLALWLWPWKYCGSSCVQGIIIICDIIIHQSSSSVTAVTSTHPYSHAPTHPSI